MINSHYITTYPEIKCVLYGKSLVFYFRRDLKGGEMMKRVISTEGMSHVNRLNWRKNGILKR